MLKKIEQTRKKAQDLLVIKQDREHRFQAKLKMELEHEDQIDRKRLQILEGIQDRKRRMDSLTQATQSERTRSYESMRRRAKQNEIEFKQFRHSVMLNKRKRAEVVKQDEKRREKKLQQYRRNKLMHNSFDYRSRKHNEIDSLKKVESNISTLETVENALLDKLQNTRANVERANKEYLSALDTAYSSQDTRIQSLKKKLEEKRQKYMHGVGTNRSASQSKLSKSGHDTSPK